MATGADQIKGGFLNEAATTITTGYAYFKTRHPYIALPVLSTSMSLGPTVPAAAAKEVVTYLISLLALPDTTTTLTPLTMADSTSVWQLPMQEPLPFEMARLALSRPFS